MTSSLLRVPCSSPWWRFDIKHTWGVCLTPIPFSTAPSPTQIVWGQSILKYFNSYFYGLSREAEGLKLPLSLGSKHLRTLHLSLRSRWDCKLAKNNYARGNRLRDMTFYSRKDPPAIKWDSCQGKEAAQGQLVLIMSAHWSHLHIKIKKHWCQGLSPEVCGVAWTLSFVRIFPQEGLLCSQSWESLL